MASAWTIPTKTKSATKPSTEVPDYFGTTTGSAVETARAARIPGADPGIFSQYTDAMQLRDILGQASRGYSDAMQKITPTLQGNAGQEVAAIGDIYNPAGLQATLQGIRERKAKALRGLDISILADTTRALGLGRVGSAGAAGGGLTSFLAKIAAAKAGTLRAQEAVSAADAERADANALLAARTTAAGQRKTLLTDLLNTILQPGEVAAKSQATASDALLKALQAALANSLTGVATKVA